MLQGALREPPDAASIGSHCDPTLAAPELILPMTWYHISQYTRGHSAKEYKVFVH